MKKQNSFTLVEVLVVIAIIGLLSTVVLISIKEAREKARIARGVRFSQSVKNALGAYIVAEWTFDDPADLGKDISGYENNATNNNVTSDSQAIRGAAAKFDSAMDVLVLETAGASPDLNDIKEEITIEAWMRLENPEISHSIVWKDSSYNLRYNSKGLSEGEIIFQINEDDNLKLISEIVPIRIGRWHHVVASYHASPSGDFLMRIYLDGYKIARNDASYSYPDNLINTNPYTITIGDGIIGFTHVLDEIRIYKAALTSAQIQEHYTEGAKKRGLLVEK